MSWGWQPWSGRIEGRAGYLLDNAARARARARARAVWCHVAGAVYAVPSLAFTIFLKIAQSQHPSQP